MKSAKRMVLVPEEMLNTFERKQRLETSPVTSDIMRSDMRMSGILDRTDLTDDEKQKLYNMNMQRLMELRQQKNTHVPAVRLAPVKEEPDAKPEVQAPARAPDADVVEILPGGMQQRATTLLARLRENPKVITWDKSGEVKIRGETIPNSNITDLVSDAMRSRKGF